MAVHIGGENIPFPMANIGQYHLASPEILGRNGAGEEVVLPYVKLTWKFAYLKYENFTWWLSRAGWTGSSTYTSLTLWGNDGKEYDYKYGILLQPEFSKLEAKLFRDVTIVIDHLTLDE